MRPLLLVILGLIKVQNRQKLFQKWKKISVTDKKFIQIYHFPDFQILKIDFNPQKRAEIPNQSDSLPGLLADPRISSTRQFIGRGATPLSPNNITKKLEAENEKFETFDNFKEGDNGTTTFDFGTKENTRVTPTDLEVSYYTYYNLLQII